MRHLDKGEAAKAMHYGGLTPKHEALSLITINPAKQLKIDNRVGSLEVGKDADVLLYDGDPLFQLQQSTEEPGSMAMNTSTAIRISRAVRRKRARRKLSLRRRLPNSAPVVVVVAPLPDRST